MLRAVVAATVTLAGCWEGHDSCGVMPPQGYEYVGSGQEAPVDAPPPVVWSAGRIEDALRIDPAPAMKMLSRGNPLLLADTDAHSLTPLCGTAALAAVDEFAGELGPRNEPPACSEIAALHDRRMLVCVRPHDGHSVVALAFVRRGEDWDLTVLMKGVRPDAKIDQQIPTSLPDVVCL